MKHCKKNLTLAKTFSVHQLNCAIRRNFQLIGSCSKQRSPKLCTMSHGYFYHESHTCSDCPAGNIGILNPHMGSIQQSHQQFGTIARNLQRSNKNQNQFICEKHICTLKLDTMGEIKYIAFENNSRVRMKRGEL